MFTSGNGGSETAEGISERVRFVPSTMELAEARGAILGAGDSRVDDTVNGERSEGVAEMPKLNVSSCLLRAVIFPGPAFKTLVAP